MDYTDVPTFDRNAKTAFLSLAKEAEHIMQQKFKLTGMEKTKGRFLDIGCSEGVYIHAMKTLGWDAYGLEVDRAKIERAKERSLNLYHFSDHGLLDKQSMDFIIVRHVIEHVPDFMAMLEIAVTLLSPSGILCIETPNQASFKSYLVRRKIRQGCNLAHIYPPTHIHGFEPKTLTLIGTKLGLLASKCITYSPADKRWTFKSLYTRTGFIPLVHKITSSISLGENIAVFYRKKSKTT